MAFSKGPRIVTDGLVFSVDASTDRSYPGSGSSWYSILPDTPTLTLNGSPSYTTLGGAQCFELNSDGDYFTGTIAGLPTETITLEAWIYPASSEITSGDRGTVILLTGGNACYLSWNKSNREMSNYWYGKNSQGYHESGPSCARGRWHHWMSVWTANDLRQFVNGTKYTVSGIENNTTGNSSINIGRESSGRQFAGGIAAVRIYNRALSDTEALQNFTAQRDRFGI